MERSQSPAPGDFDLIFRTYSSRVLTYARHHLGDPQDAEDAASQVFLKIQEKWHTYDAERGAVGTWIYAITRNEVRAVLRRRAKDEGTMEDFAHIPAQEPNPEESLTAEARLDELEAALERLPERERDIIILRFYSGLPSQEIARRMGLSDSNVRYLQSRALRKLRTMLA